MADDDTAAAVEADEARAAELGETAASALVAASTAPLLGCTLTLTPRALAAKKFLWARVALLDASAISVDWFHSRPPKGGGGLQDREDNDGTHDLTKHMQDNHGV